MVMPKGPTGAWNKVVLGAARAYISGDLRASDTNRQNRDWKEKQRDRDKKISLQVI